MNLSSFPLPLGEGEEHQLEIKLEIKKPVLGTRVVHFFIATLVHFLIDFHKIFFTALNCWYRATTLIKPFLGSSLKMVNV